VNSLDITLIFFFVLAVGSVIFVLWNFPWLTKYYTLNVITFEIKENSKILIVSDLHIKPSNITFKPLKKIIESKNIKYLVIAGDFIEYKHKKIEEEKLSKILAKILRKLGIQEKLTIFYVPSNTSHDPKMPENTTLEINSTKIYILNDVLKLDLRNFTLYITHGDYASRDGAIASTINRTLKLFGKKLFLEKLLKNVLKLERNSWLIMGHTHLPGIDSQNRVANCGAWGRHFLRKESNTAILIEKGNIKLVRVE